MIPLSLSSLLNPFHIYQLLNLLLGRMIGIHGKHLQPPNHWFPPIAVMTREKEKSHLSHAIVHAYSRSSQLRVVPVRVYMLLLGPPLLVLVLIHCLIIFLLLTSKMLKLFLCLKNLIFLWVVKKISKL
jgi:hypothetical protein